MKPVWDGDNWTCRIALPAFKQHLGSRARGRVEVIFSPEGEDERKLFPSAIQLSSLARVQTDQKKLVQVALQALRKHYDAARPRYARFAEETPHLFDDFDAQMPKSPSAAELAKRHPLRTIYVHPVVSGRHAYVGLSFSASWDVEHGVGVLLHGDRVVEVGGGDTAFLMWIAERDAKRHAKKSAGTRAKPKLGPRRKKKPSRAVKAK